MHSSSKPKISYGPRNEGIHYESQGRTTEIDFTRLDGDRIYTESISKWDDGSPISDNEKRAILTDLLLFTKGWFRKSVVVINTDDPSKVLWEAVCKELFGKVKRIEYTSNEDNERTERQTYLAMLNTGAGLTINDVSIDSEEKLDEVLASMQNRTNG